MHIGKEAQNVIGDVKTANMSLKNARERTANHEMLQFSKHSKRRLCKQQ